MKASYFFVLTKVYSLFDRLAVSALWGCCVACLLWWCWSKSCIGGLWLALLFFQMFLQRRRRKIGLSSRDLRRFRADCCSACFLFSSVVALMQFWSPADWWSSCEAWSLRRGSPQFMTVKGSVMQLLCSCGLSFGDGSEIYSTLVAAGVGCCAWSFNRRSATDSTHPPHRNCTSCAATKGSAWLSTQASWTWSV